MKLPIFHRYFSINTFIYLTILELILFIPIILYFIFQLSPYWLDIFFLLSMLSIVLLYIIHYYVMPFFALLIPIEFYLRKKGELVKAHIVNIPLKYLKYIYIFTALIYIAIIIVMIIIGQPMTEEEMMFD